MGIGNQANITGLNVQLGDCAVSLRDACNNIVLLWDYITALGSGQSAQEAALVTIGFSSGDAASFWTTANYLFAVSQLYYGAINQGTAFNYDSATALARGGS